MTAKNNEPETTVNKEELQQIAIEAISKECHERSAEHDDLRAISEGLSEGRELAVTVLTGGLCNYSYKVHFKDEAEGDVALFAKQCFGTPLLFQDVDCPRERTNNEYEAMELYAKLSPYPESTVTPYFCIDVHDDNHENMKILATQFCPNNLDEQAGNVFVDGGHISGEFATKMARGLAALHNAPVTDPDFNAVMKPFFLELAKIQPTIFEAWLAADETELDRSGKLAVSLGKETLGKVTEGYTEALQRTDCIIHGDAHGFNILVAGKPNSLAGLIESFNDTNDDTENNYGNNKSDGDFCLIDWEMSHVGPIGKDMGWLSAFPLSCLLAHSSHGDTVSAESIVNFLKILWKDYAEALNDDKDLSLVEIYRQVLGFTGILLSGYSSLGIHMEYLPLEDNQEPDKIRESIGVIALRAMEWGFVETTIDTTVEELEDRFWKLVRDEMALLAPPKRSRNRRSSLLRESGRRVSDAHTYLSLASLEEFGRKSGARTSAIEAKRASIREVEDFLGLSW